MKRNGSFLMESLQDIKRINPDITETIELVNDSVVLSSSNNSLIQEEESKPEQRIVRSVLVNYDITRIPPYDGGIGSSTKIICSKASVPTTGQTIQRNETQSPIHPIRHSIISNETKTAIQKEIGDFNKIANNINNSAYFDEIYGQQQQIDRISFSMDSNRYKCLDWLISICTSFKLSTECEIIAICLFHKYLQEYTTNPNYQLIASVCIYHSAHLLHLHPPTPIQFYDFSLHSWRENNWSEVEEQVKRLPIPCCYPLLLQQLYSITTSESCLFSSLYCLESLLIEGRKEEISILEICQRCIEYGMKKNHMEDECPFKVANEEIEKIPNELLAHHIKFLYKKYNSDHFDHVASL